MTTFKAIFEKHHTHNGVVDPEQVEVIFSKSKRLIVEAPAGYGKTKTMVSKIAYLIMSNQLPSTKKILALTFSVNASFKIKKEIFDQVRQLFADKTALALIKQRIEATNFHGFGRRVLTLYGYLIHPGLVKINQFKVIDETRATDLNCLPLSFDEKEFLGIYATTLQSIGKPGVIIKKEIKYLEDNRPHYINILLNSFVPNNCLTYNGILVLAQYLFETFSEVAKFYQEFFPIIFVDEFQDTNWLQWKILSALTGGETFPTTDRHLYLFGDRVQRIYGFIGAIPKIFDAAKKSYQMDVIKLNTNHRFESNSKLGKIDRIIRANAENVRKPQVPFTIDVPVFENASQLEVSAKVLALTEELQSKEREAVVAILVRTGLTSKTTKEIYNALQNAKIKFFYALYKEDDQEYIDFHNTCLDIWMRGAQKVYRSFKSAQSYMKKEVANLPESNVNSSLAILLNLFIENVQKEYAFFSLDEKAAMVFDVLANRGLKQHLDLVTDARVILATVHGAKGLEWDYVIIPDVQKFGFPQAHFCIGEKCKHCAIDWTGKSARFEQSFLEELSVFYVAVTRARKDIFLLFSKSVMFSTGHVAESPLSCLAKLPGLVPIR